MVATVISGTSMAPNIRSGKDINRGKLEMTIQTKHLGDLGLAHASGSKLSVGRTEGRVGSWLLALVAVGICGVGSAQAVLTTLSYSPAPAALDRMSQTSAYTWRLDNLPTTPITEATLTFSNIQNTGGNMNKLFGHLLDSAKSAGVASFMDNAVSRRPMADLTDDFANSRHHSSPDWLLAPSTDGTKLLGKSFSMTPETWTYSFTPAQVTQLNQYLSDGSIAFGFDSDSHYLNQGITFTMRFSPPGPPGASPIPEASAVLPLVLVMGMAVAQQSRSRRRSLTLPV